MDGLLAQASPGQQAAPQTPADNRPSIGGPASAQSNERMDKLQGLVLAGKKVMYDPSMKGKLLSGLRPEDPARSAADLAATLMMLIIQKDAGNVSPDLVVPAGLVLVGEALDFMAKSSDVEVTDDVSEQAVGMFVQNMLESFPQEGGQPPAQPGQPPTQPGQPPASTPQPPAQPASGMLAQGGL
jgi:hypothetical protein